MAKKKSLKPPTKITKDDLRAYLRNELPSDRYQQIKTAIQDSFFYQRVLDGIKAEDATCTSEGEKKAVGIKVYATRLFKGLFGSSPHTDDVVIVNSRSYRAAW
jgi:hypothetical protein